MASEPLENNVVQFGALEAEIANLKGAVGKALVRENNLIAALWQLRRWCADKGDLDGELMAEAALANEQEGK